MKTLLRLTVFCISFGLIRAEACVNKIITLNDSFHGSVIHLACEEDRQVALVMIPHLKLAAGSGVAGRLAEFKDLKSVIFQSKSIEFVNRISFPGTYVKIEADKVNFGRKGILDVTPRRPERPKFVPGPGVVRGVDGQNGAAGSVIVINAQDIELHGPGARLIADGGSGQDAGEGADGEELSRIYHDDSSLPPIDVVDPHLARAFAADVGHIIGISAHFSICADDGSCGANATNDMVKDQGTGNWPLDGLNAIPGGTPGVGAPGGNIYLRIHNLQNVPGSITSVAPGTNGAPDRKRLGQKAGTPNPAVVIEYVDNLAFNRLVHTQTDGQDADSPAPVLPLNISGKVFLKPMPATPAP